MKRRRQRRTQQKFVRKHEVMMLKNFKFFSFFTLATALMGQPSAFAANEVPTEFSNQGGIKNTRHNMTQSTTVSAGATMTAFRNNYGEVCVYCHTPHGANTAAGAPLWNRALPTGTTYQTYNTLNTSTLTQTVSQPGAASLPCLSCHDGSQAIDAIINMPGSGQYYATPDPTKWVSGTGQSKSGQHRTLVQCMACHNEDPNGVGGGVATDFTVFVIGTDLRNDHPVGVNFPITTGAGTDWNTPTGSFAVGPETTLFFDENTNSRMDKGDIRLYGVGSDSRVECASCHDPHGVPSGGVGSVFNPTFLRKTNTNSAVCMTCHNK